MARSMVLAATLLMALAGCSSGSTAAPAETSSPGEVATADTMDKPLVFPSTSTWETKQAQLRAAQIDQLSVMQELNSSALKEVYSNDPGEENHVIRACAGKDVTRSADAEKTAVHQVEWEITKVEGALQVIYVLPAPNAAAVAAEVAKRETACTSYRSDGTTSTHLPVGPVKLPPSAKNAAVFCVEHVHPGSPTSISCFADLTVGPVYVRLGAWAPSQARAEQLLATVIGLAASKLLDVRP